MRGIKPIAATLVTSMSLLALAPAASAAEARRFGTKASNHSRGPFSTPSSDSGSSNGGTVSNPNGGNGGAEQPAPNPQGGAEGSSGNGASSGSGTPGSSSSSGTPGGSSIGRNSGGGVPNGGGFGNNAPRPRTSTGGNDSSGPFSDVPGGDNSDRDASGADGGGFNLGRALGDFSGLVNTLYEIVAMVSMLKDLWGSLGDMFGGFGKKSPAGDLATAVAAAPAIGNNAGRFENTVTDEDYDAKAAEDAEKAAKSDDADAAGLKRD